MIQRNVCSDILMYNTNFTGFTILLVIFCLTNKDNIPCIKQDNQDTHKLFDYPDKWLNHSLPQIIRPVS